ncbi:MAG: hypothetical protein HY423_01855 [Candidatus Lambdaproteobacteria bacterium]|nr:hypothetical protein [Candidatus Lambdaproteobacteria bacterium]
MRRTAAFALCLLLIAALSACGGSKAAAPKAAGAAKGAAKGAAGTPESGAGGAPGTPGAPGTVAAPAQPPPPPPPTPPPPPPEPTVPREFSRGSEKPWAGMPPPPPQPTIPFDQAFPGERAVEVPLRIGILGDPRQPEQGRRLAVKLDEHDRTALERDLGRPILLSFVALAARDAGAVTQVRFRAGFLKAALRVAEATSASQAVQPMTSQEALLSGVDVLILVGRGLR